MYKERARKAKQDAKALAHPAVKAALKAQQKEAKRHAEDTEEALRKQLREVKEEARYTTANLTLELEHQTAAKDRAFARLAKWESWWAELSTAIDSRLPKRFRNKVLQWAANPPRRFKYCVGQ